MREATREEHERTERAVEARWFDGGMDRERYAAYLEALLGFHRPLEERLAPAVRRHLEGLAPRGRSARLERDLRTLGRDAARVAAVETVPGERLPTPDGPARALGCLYVVEGAELGGRVIWKRLEGSLDDEARRADAFLGTDADRARARWRRFQATFDGHVGGGAPFESALDAARATFRAFRGWMS